MKSLVTGGAGFIGSHVVEGLLDLGHEVVVVDNETGQASDIFHWNNACLNYKVDVTSRCDMETIMMDHTFDYVFHLAAKTKIVPAMEDPPTTLLENYSGLLNVLELSRRQGVKRVIFSSSSSVYGEQAIPYTEASPPSCINPYALSKFHGELLCKHYSDVFDLDTVCLRYFNVFGDRMPEKGQYAPVIAIFLRQLRNDQPLTIEGDGQQKRDFVYVKDVARANISAAIFVDDFGGDVFNVGSASMVSVKDLADLISDHQVHLPPRECDARNTQAHIARISLRLGWLPTVDAVSWVKEFLSI
jgi:UDP-glucose 4-epimerase